MSYDDGNKRLEKIAEFVKERLYRVADERKDSHPKNDPDYRWHHTLRVSNYGKVLAQAEGAQVELVIAGCLLHDVSVLDPDSGVDHGRLGAEIARPLLASLGYSPDEVDIICYSIAAHVDEKHLETLEARIVTDADNIDRFGAYRAALWIEMHKGNYQELIPAMMSRIDHLKELREKFLLQTAMGNAMFNEQLDFQIQFFESMLREADWALVPQL